MNDLILYRNEWYEVNQYLKGTVILEDGIGNKFKVPNNTIQAPKIKFYYA